MPGPVAFGRGGTEPTLTDACLVMGLIDPEYYLGGTMTVDADAARAAIEEKIAGPLGMSTEEAAGAIYDVMVAAMANNVRAVSIQKGYDPRDFAMVSFGGAGGMILPAVCQAALVGELIIPVNAATFSAFGLLTTDYKRDYLRSVHWRPGDDPSELNATFEELREEGERDLTSAGFDAGAGTYECEVDMRFVGQFFELTIPVTTLPLGEDEVKELDRAFTARYEREYGEGTGWIGAPAEIVHARLHASAKLPSFVPKPAVTSTNGNSAVSNAQKGSREVYLRSSRERSSVPVYEYERLLPGMAFDGPCVIEGSDTTVMLLEGMHCRADEYGNLRVAVEATA
jgi:N-methylhydantoinase A